MSFDEPIGPWRSVRNRSVAESRLSNFVGGGKGIPGNYNLNQKVTKFGDRRTKRQRDRSTKKRNEIDRSARGE